MTLPSASYFNMAVGGILARGMRVGMADLPEYTEAIVQTKERKIVRELTEILDTPLDSVDADVGACMTSEVCRHGQC